MDHMWHGKRQGVVTFGYVDVGQPAIEDDAEEIKNIFEGFGCRWWGLPPAEF